MMSGSSGAALPDRFAAIADVHGNADALAAVLADIDAAGITAVVNLGDCLSGPLDAARTAALMMARDMPTVRGNHDRWLVAPPPEGPGQWERWTLPALSPAVTAWLAALPATRQLGDVFLCHAVPGDDLTYWLHRAGAGTMLPRGLDEITALAAGAPADCSLLLCGHTHQQAAVQLADGRLVVNPGSVGNPAYADDAPEDHVSEAGSPHARYAILSRGAAGWAVEFRLVAWDSTAAVARAAEAGAQSWVRALTLGRA